MAPLELRAGAAKVPACIRILAVAPFRGAPLAAQESSSATAPAAPALAKNSRSSVSMARVTRPRWACLFSEAAGRWYHTDAGASLCLRQGGTHAGTAQWVVVSRPTREESGKNNPPNPPLSTLPQVTDTPGGGFDGGSQTHHRNPHCEDCGRRTSLLVSGIPLCAPCQTARRGPRES